MKISTNFQEEGVFAVKTPTGAVNFSTFSNTAAGAISKSELDWAEAEAAGFTVIGFAEQVLVTQRKVRSNLNIPKTADGWDLYSSNPDSDAAALVLGTKLEELVVAAHAQDNCNMEEARRIRDIMYAEMTKYEHLGARDTEPETILVYRIERALSLYNPLPR